MASVCVNEGTSVNFSSGEIKRIPARSKVSVCLFSCLKINILCGQKLLEGNYRVVSKQKALLSVPDSARRPLFSSERDTMAALVKRLLDASGRNQLKPDF